MTSASSDSVPGHEMARERGATEWAVLALVAEGPTHGFAIARDLAADGPVGAIWTTPRPLVYRALEALERDGMIAEAGVEPGAAGPPRRLMKVTRTGSARVRRWLDEPVRHVRDGRSLLLLKLLFLDRAGRDPASLATAQRARFADQLAEMEARRGLVGGFERTALDWRIRHTRAALEFVEALSG